MIGGSNSNILYGSHVLISQELVESFVILSFTTFETEFKKAFSVIAVELPLSVSGSSNFHPFPNSGLQFVLYIPGKFPLIKLLRRAQLIILANFHPFLNRGLQLVL